MGSNSSSFNEFAEDVLELANDGIKGNIIGYSVVVVYESGYNTRICIPSGMDIEFFKSYIKEMINE